MSIFRVEKNSSDSQARLGLLHTPRGTVHTPAFMPIATRGVVKSVTPQELKQAGAEIILANTYHLLLKPGLALLKKTGGLHDFMGWDGPILTDSGGFQIHSLSSWRRITDRGVEFRDPETGKRHRLTPETSLKIQSVIGSDIRMVLDDLTGYPATAPQVATAVDRTTAWAKRSVRVKSAPALTFGIVQGSVLKTQREKSLAQITTLPFDGFALGGLAVGEPVKAMMKIIAAYAPRLPADKPRYVMGYGKPEQIVAAVRSGVDLFDCVLPTRNARHGLLYVWRKNAYQRGSLLAPSKPWYEEMRIMQSRFEKDIRPIDPQCDCPACAGYSRAYLRHLFKIKDTLAARLATLHNLRFYLSLMERLRDDIARGWL